MFYSKGGFKQKNKGQVLIIIVIFFLFTSIIILYGFVTPVVKQARISRDILQSKESYFLAEAGVEDVIYRVRNGMNLSNLEIISLNQEYATTTLIDTGPNEKKIISEGDVQNRIRNIEVNLVLTSDEALFNFGVQSDVGGIHMKNTSTVNGNIYSNGPVTGENSNLVNGDVVSAGPSGLIDGVNVSNDAYANTITDSDVSNDVYYDTLISGTTVGGMSFPGSADQPTSTLPISDSLVESWKTQAETGGVISSPCPYEIDSQSVSLGPIKIECDLNIKGSSNVTLNGFVWVEGDITIQNTSVVRLAPSFGTNSTGFIADDESNRTTSSKIELKNSGVFQNSGTVGSYVIVISQNNSAENSGSDDAINVQNTVSGDLLIYAGHGKIDIQNSINLKQVTGYKIELKNSAQIDYETGLSSLLFSSGPSGGWEMANWREIE